MKNRLKGVIAAVCCVMLAMGLLVPVSAMAKKSSKGSAVFKEKIHNFGIVKEDGGPVSCTFSFTNGGDGNLVIYEVKADCGCTRPDYPQNPIGPGKSGKIKVTYNPLGRPGAFDKTVTVKTNGSPSKIRLKIKGTVNPKSK